MQQIEVVNRGGAPRLAHLRISVYDIIPYMEKGYDPNSIALALQLSTAEVLALQRYIEEHREEVMEQERLIKERIARGNPPEIEARRQALRPQFLARCEELRRKAKQEGTNGASHSV